MINSNKITYASNAGVLIKMNDKKILIDGLCNSKEPIYKSTTEEIKEQIIQGISPFDSIDIMLITHRHSDHFDASSIAKFLKKNSNTIVISAKDVVSKIIDEDSSIDISRLIALETKLYYKQRMKINGIEIFAMSMIHDGKEYVNVSNFAYIVKTSMDHAILHLGDAAPIIENFEPLKLHQHKIDVLIANFPYVSIPSARKVVKEYIKPKKIAVVHLPYKELDRFGWITAAKKSYERVKDDFMPAEFLEDIGMSISI